MVLTKLPVGAGSERGLFLDSVMGQRGTEDHSELGETSHLCGGLLRTLALQALLWQSSHTQGAVKEVSQHGARGKRGESPLKPSELLIEPP